MDIFNFLKVFLSAILKQIQKIDLLISIGPSELDSKNPDQNLQPPLELLDFPPLAEVCNAILSSLNEIRLCSIMSLAPKLIQRIETILISCSQTLKDRESRFGKSSIGKKHALKRYDYFAPNTI